MKKIATKLSLILAMAMVLTTITACGNNENNADTSTEVTVSSESTSVTETTSEEDSEEASSIEEASVEVTEEASSDITVLGEGAVTFYFDVTTADKETTNFQINTDKDTVGTALLELGLIEGEDSEYGLYVKTVNGVTADYNVDGTYWAFYINGEYAMTGVDSTPVEADATYAFVVE